MMSETDEATFAALGVAPELVAVLDEQGIIRPFAIQGLTVADALAGRDVCGKAKTGSGKTLAFGLPLLQRLMAAEPAATRKPRALVLTPTRELALQVREVLAPLAAAVDRQVISVTGGGGMVEQVSGLKGGADAVIATPGRLIDLIDRKEVTLGDIELVVIDEADRMADMGFLPQVEWVLRHVGRAHQTLLFSATLDGGIQSLVDRYQRDPVFHEVASEMVTVEAMTHRFLMVHEMDQAKVAASIASHTSRAIVFVNTKRACDRVARAITDAGVNAKAIHGDLRQEVRVKVLKQFTEGKLHVLVATDVAARGLDIDNVDVVIHYDPAPEHKTYIHRSGRTARAGATGLAVTLGLWNQELEIKRVQKRLGLEQPIVEMFSNDPRLADLAAWDPTEAA
jgi:superfamily II DNA/RNA helicase